MNGMRLIAIVGESSSALTFLESNIDGWRAISERVDELNLILFTQENGIVSPFPNAFLHLIPIFGKGFWRKIHLFHGVLSVFYGAIKLIQLSKKTKSDIIVALTGSSFLFSGFLANILLHKPLVVIMLGNDFYLRYKKTAKYRMSGLTSKLASNILNLFEFNCLRKADKIACVSFELSKVLHRYGIPRSKIVVVWNGVWLKKFSPKRSQGLNKNMLRLLYAGRLSWEKKVETIIRAIRILQDGGIKNIELRIVGDGPQMGFLKRYTKRMGLKNVYFIGRQPHEKMPQIISDADAVVLASISEGLPSVVLEAMSCGKVVICSNVGELPYIIKDGKNGFLFSAGNALELANKIKKIVMNKELAKSIGDEARRTVEQSFSWEKIAEKYSYLFKEVSMRR